MGYQNGTSVTHSHPFLFPFVVRCVRLVVCLRSGHTHCACGVSFIITVSLMSQFYELLFLLVRRLFIERNLLPRNLLAIAFLCHYSTLTLQTLADIAIQIFTFDCCKGPPV